MSMNLNNPLEIVQNAVADSKNQAAQQMVSECSNETVGIIGVNDHDAIWLNNEFGSLADQVC